MGQIIAKITVNDNRFFIFESKPDNIKLIEKLFTYEDTSECFFRGKFRKEKIKYINFVWYYLNTIQSSSSKACDSSLLFVVVTIVIQIHIGIVTSSTHNSGNIL